MGLSVVIAQDEAGKIAVLHASLDADAALVAYRSEKALADAKLKGAVKISMFRKPIAYKRREVFQELAALKVMKDAKL